MHINTTLKTLNIKLTPEEVLALLAFVKSHQTESGYALQNALLQVEQACSDALTP